MSNLIIKLSNGILFDISLFFTYSFSPIYSKRYSIIYLPSFPTFLGAMSTKYKKLSQAYGSINSMLSPTIPNTALIKFLEAILFLANECNE